MMLQLRPSADFKHPEFSLSAGHNYLADQVNVGQILTMLSRENIAADVSRWTCDGCRLNKSGHVAVVRAGGFGDLILLTPVLLALAKKYPYVDVSCFSKFAPAIKGISPNVRAIPYPLDITSITYDTTWALGGLVEFGAGKHTTDAFAEHVGVELRGAAAKKAVWVEDPEEGHKADGYMMPLPTKNLVAIQPMASALIRSYPPQMMAEVIGHLNQKAPKDFTVGLFGAPGQLAQYAKDLAECGGWSGHKCRGLIDFTAPQRAILSADGSGPLAPPSFRESVALIRRSAVFLGVDSALLHAAGASDVPSVALYGPFPWKERTRYAPSIYNLQGKAPCAPCHFHSFGGPQFPEGMPCEQACGCIAMASISPKRISAKMVTQGRWK